MIGETVEIIGCHAEGEVGDVIVSGVAPPPGATLWEQSRWIAEDGRLRDYVLNEPRGGVFRHVNLLVPPIDPRADAAFIIMEPEDTPPMSGSNTICVATVLLNTGRVAMEEPVTRMTLEAPGGLVAIEAECSGGKARRIRLRNVASYADRLDVPLEVAGEGTFKVDTAYGGDSFVIVDAARLGFDLVPDEASELVATGNRFTAAATEQLGFSHPQFPELRHISFCLFAGPVFEEDGVLATRHAVVIRPGKLDRSPTGTGVSARLAVLHARGRASRGTIMRARSIIDSTFEGRIEEITTLAGKAAIRPSISGRAWITERRTLKLDPDDPYPRGYRIADTWGASPPKTG